jgi:hypothetical protein
MENVTLNKIEKQTKNFRIMKTFIVLIPVENSLIDPRGAAEMIENAKFDIGGSVQATAIDVRAKVMFEFGLNSAHNIEVETITDFMDRFNDEMLNPDDYFMSYVYA